MDNRLLGILLAFMFILGGSVQARATETINQNSVEVNKTDFVDIQEIIPSVVLDIKYATTDNFTHTKLYDSPQAILRQGTADKLKKVAEEVEEKGYGLKIWDAYRSPDAQLAMWKLVPDTRYIANPYKGYSNHSRGSAVDLTLVDVKGKELAMPTGFDDFTVAAARANQNENAKYLKNVMTKHGFKPLAIEWWHFDDTDSYKPADSVQVLATPVLWKDDETTITLSAIGDVTLGQDPRFLYVGSFDEYYKLKGPKYFFRV